MGTLRHLAEMPLAEDQHVIQTLAFLAEFVCHYNGHRPHQSLRQELPRRVTPGRAVDTTARIERRQDFGGLISEYRRAT